MLFVNETNALNVFRIAAENQIFPRQTKYQATPFKSFSRCASKCANDVECFGFLFNNKTTRCERYYLAPPRLGRPMNVTGQVLYEKLTVQPIVDYPSILVSSRLSNESSGSSSFDIPSLYMDPLFPIVCALIGVFLICLCLFVICRKRLSKVDTKAQSDEESPRLYRGTVRASFESWVGRNYNSSQEDMLYDMEHIWKDYNKPDSKLQQFNTRSPRDRMFTVQYQYTDVDLDHMARYSQCRFSSVVTDSRSLSQSGSGTASKSSKVLVKDSSKKPNERKVVAKDSTEFPKTDSLYIPFSYTPESVKRHLSVDSPTSKIKFFHIPFEEIQRISVVGTGHFGDVWYAKWNGANVAIKQLSRGRTDDLLEESKILLKMNHHPHVCQIYGLTSEGSQIYMVQHFYRNGSVADFFKTHQVPMTLKLRFICHACMGIEFLHKNNVVHRDIAARNLLVNGSLGVCVSE